MAVKLIDGWECRLTRANVKAERERHPDTFDKYGPSGSFGRDGIGDLEIIEGTGRATCRECGRKIKRGDKAIKGFFDFTGNGSWTAVAVQIHFNDCN